MAIPIIKLGVSNNCKDGTKCKTGGCQCDSTALEELARKLNYRLSDKIVAITTVIGVKQNPVIKLGGSNLQFILSYLEENSELVIDKSEAVVLTQTANGTLSTLFRVRREDRQIHVVHGYLSKIQSGTPITKKELGNVCSPLGVLVRECYNM